MGFGNKYYPMSIEKLEQSRIVMEDVQVVIIDELSMIGADRLYQISRRLQELFPLYHDEPFGGRAVILLGDIMQLPPVRASFIFAAPRDPKNQGLWNSNHNLWNKFEVITLKTNFRQGEGNPWIEMLNRIRTEEHDEQDLALLEERRISNYPNKNFEEAMHVYYTKAQVEDWNRKKLGTLEARLVTLEAVIVHPPGVYPFIDENTGTIDDTNFLKSLKLKVGARVMLVFNVSIPDSLINGAMGTVKGFCYGKDGKEIIGVFVKFDNPEIGRDHGERHKHLIAKYPKIEGIPIFKSTLEYQKSAAKSSRQHGTKCRVSQFPLRLSWASTAHKLQGTTIKKGNDLVVHGHKRLPKNMVYVMLSRVSDIKNVFIDDEFDFDKILCHPASAEENEKLKKRCIMDKLKSCHFDLFYTNIYSLSRHYPDIQSDPLVQNSDIKCFVETWTDKPKPIEDHHLVHASWKGDSRGKNCCIYIRNTLEFTVLYKYALEDLQIISIRVHETIQLTLVYSKNKPKDSIALVSFLEQRKVKDCSQIIIGDFNFDSVENDSGSNRVKNHFKKENIIQIVQGRPTHSAGHTLDHCYVSQDLHEKIQCHFKNYHCTDHTSILLNFPDK